MATKDKASTSLADEHPAHTDSNISLRTTPPECDYTTEIALSGQTPSDVWDDMILDLIDGIANGVKQTIQNTHPMKDSETIAKEISIGKPTDVEKMFGTYLAPGVGGWTDREKHRLIPFLVNAPSRVKVEVDHLCSILRVVDVEAPIIIRIGDEFREQRKSQREDICQLISNLAMNNEIYIVGSLLKQRWLANTHTPDLPGSLISQCNTVRESTPDEKTKQQQVEKAIDKFDPDGGIVGMLRYIARKPDESATFDELDDRYDVNRDTIHRRVSELREDLGLLSETRNTADGSEVSVTSTGRAFLDAVYEESGIQTTFEESLIGSGKCQHNNRVNPPATREVVDEVVDEVTQPTMDRPRLPHLHTPHEIQQHKYFAASSTVKEETLTITDTKITDETAISKNEDRGSAGIYYNHDDRELLVEAEFDNPLQWMVSVVNALSNPRYLNTILDTEKLKDAGAGAFIDQLNSQKEFLRQKRCLESLPDDIDGVEEYTEELVERGQEILNMTRELHHDEYPDTYSEPEYRGEVCRASIGYIGSIAHILDLVDVDLIEQIKIPSYTKLSTDDRDELVRMLGKMCSIQSVYKHATTQRQVYEKRDGKRKQMMEVDVDPVNPYSTLISTFSIISDFGSKQDDFIDRLNSETFEPGTPHEDAPEIQLKTVLEKENTRQEYVETITSVCSEKNISPTPQAISTLAAFCNTPFEAAEAINWLEPNDEKRRIDAREVRYGLSRLTPEDIFHDLNGHYIQQVVMELLESSEPQTKSDIIDAVGVCDDTVEKYLETLKSTGIVKQTMTSHYRLNLSYNTGGERTSDIYPEYVVEPDKPAIHKAAKALKIGLRHHNGQPVPNGDFPTTGGREWCLDLRDIDNADPWVEEILPLLWNVKVRDEYNSEVDELLGKVYNTENQVEVMIGPELTTTGLERYADA